MSIKAVLFDLDGTLLPMEQKDFMDLYFKGLSTKLAPHGYDPKKLVESVWAGTVAMVKNTGEKTNEEAFWDYFDRVYEQDVKQDIPIFDDFYRNEFIEVKNGCGFNPLAGEVVSEIKKLGFRVALATNPLFPAIATENRIRWAGFTPEDFECYTTYENSHYCKPNPKYYEEVIANLGLQAEECLMVGNDVTEDMVAETIGMKVFLLTDCLINKENKDISAYPNGSFKELLDYIKSL